jgi:hypothetical protein
MHPTEVSFQRGSRNKQALPLTTRNPRAQLSVPGAGGAPDRAVEHGLYSKSQKPTAHFICQMNLSFFPGT